MNRRDFLRTTAAATVGLALAPAARAARKPNIVFILADDLGYGDISCQGQQRFKTPHIDRLAAEGVRFTQHYAGATVCAPSRSALMTGQHTGHTPIRGNKAHKPVGQAPLPGASVTVAEALRGAGYATGAFGKWGLGYPGSEGEPLKQGFDRFFGYNCQSNAHNYYPTWLYDDAERIELDGKTYTHDLIMEQALDFIRTHRERPFFCFLPVTIPHAAMQAPEAYRAPFEEPFAAYAEIEGRYVGDPVKNPIAAFAGMMAKLDESVGQVMALLRGLGLEEDTLVLFSSDNGPHHEGGHRPDFFDCNGPLRGYKRDLYEGGIRVPFIARWKGRIAPGSTSDHISAFWDFLPTACELAGANVPPGIDGISLLPALRGEKTAEEHEYLYWEFHEQGGKRAARMGDWKGVQLNVSKDPDGPVEIYNLAIDPGETVDLGQVRPDLVERFRGIFRNAHTPSEMFPW